jgi:hypothetical protein
LGGDESPPFFMSNQHHSHKNHSKKWHTRPLPSLVGVLSYLGTNDKSMTFTEKLIFIASFMWMLNWGTRVTSVAIQSIS